MSKDGGKDKCLLERVESIMIGGVKLLRNIFSDKVCQWNNDVQIIEDRLVIEISKT